MKKQIKFSIFLSILFFGLHLEKMNAQHEHESHYDLPNNGHESKSSASNQTGTTEKTEPKSTSSERKETMAERKDGNEKGICVERMKTDFFGGVTEKRTEMTRKECEQRMKNNELLIGTEYDIHFEPTKTSINGTTENCELPKDNKKYKKLPKLD